MKKQRCNELDKLYLKIVGKAEIVLKSDSKDNYRIHSLNRPGRLLNFWTLRVGAYSRWRFFEAGRLLKFQHFQEV